MESVVAIELQSMIAKPSIAFNDFAGTAKEVTARNVNGRNVLSVRAKQSRTVTPAQAIKRIQLSKISRAYKQLTDSQMSAWGLLAEHLKGISTFGKAAEMTAHNAFVRINSNRAMVGMPLLDDAPSYLQDVPEVDYEDFWVTPTLICFTGIEKPQDSYNLVIKMSAPQSNGVTNGWSKTVIVSSDLEDDWGDVNVTKVYASKFGFAPQIGDKVFIELYWLDAETGFVGETTSIKATVKADSQVSGETFVKRNVITYDDLATTSKDATLSSFYIDQAPGSAIQMAEVDIDNKSISMGVSGRLKSTLSDTFLAGRCYFPARCRGRSAYSIGLWECYIYYYKGRGDWQLANRAGVYDGDSILFGTSPLVNY